MYKASRLARKLIRSRLIRKALRPGVPVIQWMNHWRHSVLTEVDGIRYRLDLNQLIDSSIYFFGGFEADTVAAMRKCISPGDVVLDIGANVGCHALLFSKLVGPTGKVVAFEPMAWAFQKLCVNRDLNDFAAHNLKVEKMAIGDINRTAQRARFKSSWPMFGAPADIVEDTVDFCTLDSYVASRDLRRVDFIKVDVDGYEHKVIQGGQNTIAHHRPAMLLELCGYALESTGDSLESLVKMLYFLDYDLMPDSGSRCFSSVQQVLDAVPPDSSVNVICTPHKGR